MMRPAIIVRTRLNLVRLRKITRWHQGVFNEDSGDKFDKQRRLVLY